MPPTPQNGPNDHSEDASSALDRLQQRLYSAQQKTSLIQPTLAHHEPAQKSEAWMAPPVQRPRKRISWTIWFLIAATVFAALAGGISLLFLVNGGRSVSNDNIAISIQGPTTISSGTPVPLTITIQNHNPAAITDTSIALDFPDGTRSAGDMTQPLVRYDDNLGTLPAGGSSTRSVQAVLFGSTNQTITLPVTLEYHTANSNAVFKKQENYTFTITSSPLSLSATAVPSVAAGQPFTISVSVRSNAATTLDSLAVAVSYPSGFIPQQTSTSSGSLLQVGTLAPGQQKNLVVRGTLTGSDSTERIFGFTVGTPKSDGSGILGVAYASQETTIAITKPFLNVNLAVNNSDDDQIVVAAGQSVAASVAWSNTLNRMLTNGSVAVKITGNAVNPGGITASNGYYNSSNGTVLFTGSSASGLGQLNPGDSGSGSFSFGIKSGTAITSLRNPTIQLAVSIAGQPSGGSTQSISNTVIKTIKVGTDLELSSRVVRNTGPFTNTGPLPPKANTASTYTVLLSVTDTVNSVGGATATMILPPYVTFTGAVSPSDGSITFDQTSHTVTWKAGDVAAGTGFGSAPLGAAFQVSLVPSTAQVNTSPILIENQTITGTDRFTGAAVGNTVSALTTQTPTDSGYSASFGEVTN